MSIRFKNCPNCGYAMTSDSIKKCRYNYPCPRCDRTTIDMFIDSNFFVLRMTLKRSINNLIKLVNQASRDFKEFLDMYFGLY